MTTSSVRCQKHHGRTSPTPVSPSSASRPAVFGCLTHISPLNANESSSVVCYSSSVGIPKVLLWFVTVYRVFELRQRLGSDLSSLRYGPSCTPVSIKSLPFCSSSPQPMMDESKSSGVSPQMRCCSNSFSGLWYLSHWLICFEMFKCKLHHLILCKKYFKDTNRTTLTELQQLSHIFVIWSIIISYLYIQGTFICIYHKYWNSKYLAVIKYFDITSFWWERRRNIKSTVYWFEIQGNTFCNGLGSTLSVSS